MRTDYLKASFTLFVLAFAAGCAEPVEPAASSPEEVIDHAPTPSKQLAAAERPAAPQSLPEKTSTHDDSWMTVPSKWRLPSQETVEISDSWDNRVARLPGRDQGWLSKLNESYDGSLAFSTREEQQWMVQQGFPMPEEWLAARAMPDAELQRLAQSGNQKGQLLYMDRISTLLSPLLSTGQGLGNSPADHALLKQLSEAKTSGMLLLRSTRSPAAAYLYGRLLSSSAQHTPPEPMVGALLLAADLGDPRAQRLRTEYSRRHPDLDGSAVMSAYELMKTVVAP